MADQKALKKRLKALMSIPENQICSDCTERQPRWASLIVPPPGAPQGSLPIGALCCLECSGSHRRLGVHISFVRSINLDSWKEKEVLAMENGGNAKVNAIFEARLSNPSAKPSNHASGPQRERFIRDKYERRKYYDPAGFEAYANGTAMVAAEAPVSAPSRTTTVGPPSDAAKQRLEQRRARMKKTPSAEQKPERKGSRQSKHVAKAPASAPPPSVDLLDLMGTSEPSPAPAPASNTDLFDLMPSGSAAPAASAQPAAQPSKPYGADIMSLYGNNSGSGGMQQPQANSGFGFTQSNPMMANNIGMNGGGMMPMMNAGMQQLNNGIQQQNQMHQMNAMMQNMQFNPQQQQMMMHQQQQQMMYLQQQQQQMMQQQKIKQQHMNGFGAQQQPPSQRQQKHQPKRAPEKEDPFAQFGSNVFRS